MADPLYNEVSEHIRVGDAKQALRGILLLLRYARAQLARHVKWEFVSIGIRLRGRCLRVIRRFIWRGMLGRWDYQNVGPFPYGGDTSYEKAAAFLDGHGTVEDWGCGAGYAKRFFTSPYIGVDGSSGHADVIADLRNYVSSADCILMRHSLEHNYEWRKVLRNALQSFRQRMVLVIFTPFQERTVEIDWNPIRKVPDIAFRKEDLTGMFSQFAYTEETFTSDTQYKTETIFYIRR